MLPLIPSGLVQVDIKHVILQMQIHIYQVFFQITLLSIFKAINVKVLLMHTT